MARIELIDDDLPPQAARRPRAGQSVRKNAVGGSVVSSMKRGMKKDTSSRVYLLGFVAFALLILLNWAWISRLHHKVQSVGGWGSVVENGKRWVGASLGAVKPKDEI